MDQQLELSAASAFAAEKLGNGGGCHDLDHTFRVLANAEKLLAVYPQADEFCVKMAVWLHDVARPLEDEQSGKCCHAELGAKIAEKYLETRNFPADLRKKICGAVLRHRFRGNIYPETLEEKIVFDADKLDSLGAVGLGRAFLFAGKCGARLHNTKDEALNSPAYSVEDTAYREYLVKLSKLPEVMQTEAARKTADERVKFMAEFFSTLEEEIRQTK